MEKTKGTLTFQLVTTLKSYVCSTLVAVLMIGFSPFGFAQQIKRVELPIPAFTDSYFTIPIGKQGVLLLVQTSKNTFALTRLSTDFEQLWSLNGSIDEKLDYVTHCYDGKFVFLLFSKYESNVYQVVKVYLGPGFIESYDIYSMDKVKVSQFKAYLDNVYIAGDVRNQPVILYTNLGSRQTKMLPNAVKGEAEIQSIDIDTLAHRINVSYSVRQGKSSQILVKSFDEQGRQDLQVIVEPDDDYSLINGRMVSLNDSIQLMLGTYGFRGNQPTGTMPVSQGLYISKVLPDQVLNPRYYSFTDFQNFFNYLSPRDRERQERKIQAKREKGEDLRLTNYRFLVHDLIKKENQYIVVAEAFYPEYRYNNSYNPYGYSAFNTPFGWGWGNTGLLNPWAFGYGSRNLFYNNMYGYNSYSNQRQIFDGWVYTHAIVAGFDYNGTLLWDNSIEFKDVKKKVLHEKIKTRIEGDQLTLLYTNKGGLIKKVIQGNKTIEDTQRTELDTQQVGDKIRSNDDDDAEFWYDNYFIAWGTQRIVGDNGRRSVFYLTKIAY
ncbi:MAG: hypothetical protein U0Y10_16370 [Spirosomataceae bacterium]